MNNCRLDNLIQYILALASQEDDFHERQLGPIHIIKYVYIADMEYAKYNNGKTFTDIKWRFYNFGPWSNDVNIAIEPTLSEIHAVKEEFPSKYAEDDYVRWELKDTDKLTLNGLESNLDMVVKSTLKHYVHRFKNNTSALLHFVYATLPILNAAPGEYLDFSIMKREIVEHHQKADSNFVPLLERVSSKQRNNLISGMDELRKSFQEKFKKKKFESRTRRLRYDAVFEKGIQWLDSLAGEKIPDDGAVVEIDKSVWKSEARRGYGE